MNKNEGKVPSGEISWGVQLPSLVRYDGRMRNFELRPHIYEIQPLSNAHGSARFQMGLTSVLAAVYGPREGSISVSRGPRVTNQGDLNVILRPMYGKLNHEYKYIEHCLFDALDSVVDLSQCMHTTVTVIIQPELDDGGLLSCAINAAVASLLHAQIPMKFTMLSISLIQSRQGYHNCLLLDPCRCEVFLETMDLSTYLSCTVNANTGALVQCTPEVIELNHTLRTPLTYQVPFDQNQWEHQSGSISIPFLDSFAAVLESCRILKMALQEAFQKYLYTLVKVTIRANNHMDISLPL